MSDGFKYDQEFLFRLLEQARPPILDEMVLSVIEGNSLKDVAKSFDFTLPESSATVEP